jgi:hypothetical protein
MNNMHNVNNMQAAVNITISTVCYWQKVVYDGEQHFLDRFAPFATDVVSVSWNAEQMIITVASEEGGFITETYTMREWTDYMLQITDTTT